MIIFWWNISSINLLVAQPVKHLTGISDFLGDEPNILDLFLNSPHSACAVEPFSQLGSSDHSLVSVFCPFTVVKPPDPFRRRRLWHYSITNWNDLRQYFQDFPWNDLCFCGRDITKCAELIMEVISGMEACNPHLFSRSNSNNSWFNHTCSTAIYNKKKAFRRYQRLQTVEFSALYISSLNSTLPKLT